MHMRGVGSRYGCSIAAVTVFCGIGLTGCDNTPSAPTPTTTYQGNWFGTTSQGLPISFTVTGNAVTSISLSYTIYPTSPGCIGNGTGSTVVTPTNPISIMGSAFSSQGVLFDMTGMFSSDTAASGTVALGTRAPTGGGCSSAMSATWKATRGQ